MHIPSPRRCTNHFYKAAWRDHQISSTNAILFCINNYNSLAHWVPVNKALLKHASFQPPGCLLPPAPFIPGSVDILSENSYKSRSQGRCCLGLSYQEKMCSISCPKSSNKYIWTCIFHLISEYLTKDRMFCPTFFQIVIKIAQRIPTSVSHLLQTNTVKFIRDLMGIFVSDWGNTTKISNSIQAFL